MMGKGLLAFHPVCDYCEHLWEILIFGNQISLISYFLDGVQGSLEAVLFIGEGPRTRTQ